MKMQYTPFVIVVDHVDQNISPSVVSNLLDPCHQTSSSHFFLILGAWSWNDCNFVLSDLWVLKLWPAVALCVLFPIPLVWPNLDSPRKSYTQYHKMTWLYTFSEEWTCMKWHVSLFLPYDLKNIHKKLHSVVFLYLLTKFQSDAQNKSYDYFPQVTCLECNSGVCKKANFLRS